MKDNLYSTPLKTNTTAVTVQTIHFQLSEHHAVERCWQMVFALWITTNKSSVTLIGFHGSIRYFTDPWPYVLTRGETICTLFVAIISRELSVNKFNGTSTFQSDCLKSILYAFIQVLLLFIWFVFEYVNL